jgi:hypothetical protein
MARDVLSSGESGNPLARCDVYLRFPRRRRCQIKNTPQFLDGMSVVHLQGE